MRVKKKGKKDSQYVNMPKMDGFEVCMKIRELVSCPIIFLTAREEEQDRIKGLEIGGDDYILKPFSLKELEDRSRMARYSIRKRK